MWTQCLLSSVGRVPDWWFGGPRFESREGRIFSLKFLLMRKWTKRWRTRTWRTTTTQVIPWSLADGRWPQTKRVPSQAKVKKRPRFIWKRFWMLQGTGPNAWVLAQQVEPRFLHNEATALGNPRFYLTLIGTFILIYSVTEKHWALP